MPANIWLDDFKFEGTAVRVRKTGALVPVEPGTIGETLSWLWFYLALEARTAFRTKSGPRLWFAPDKPRPWYLIWAVRRLAGLPLAGNPSQADLGMCFEDETVCTVPTPPQLDMINGQCPDVSKSRVAAVFEQVTGRALSVDPSAYHATMVAKSEKNGAHDGRLVDGPCAGTPGLVYQKLIDASASDGMVEDLRCPTVGGQIPVVFMKRRPISQRFENANSEVRLLDPNQVFSADERAMIADFCKAMGLDWGGLDILRERGTGDLWIVDVNKTDMGPPTALPLNDKMRATRTLAHAFRQFVETRVRA